MTTEAQPLSAECCLFDAQVEETVRERQRKLAAFEIETMNIVDTEVVALIRIIDACRAENDRMREEKRTYSLALQSLTPGGSEYVDDPERCVVAARDAREFWRKAAINFKRQLKLATDGLERIEAAKDGESGVCDFGCREIARDTLAAVKEAGNV